MEKFSALLALCAGNSPVNGEFPSQRPVTRSFGVFFDLRLNKRLSWGWWFETPSCSLWRHFNALCLASSLTLPVGIYCHVVSHPSSRYFDTTLSFLIFHSERYMSMKKHQMSFVSAIWTGSRRLGRIGEGQLPRLFVIKATRTEMKKINSQNRRNNHEREWILFRVKWWQYVLNQNDWWVITENIWQWLWLLFGQSRMRRNPRECSRCVAAGKCCEVGAPLAPRLYA